MEFRLEARYLLVRSSHYQLNGYFNVMKTILVPQPISIVRRIPNFDDAVIPKKVIVPITPKRTAKPKAKRIYKPRPYVRVAVKQKPGPAMKTHCIRGHEMTEATLYYPKTGRRKRECKPCRAIRVSQCKKRKKITNGHSYLPKG